MVREGGASHNPHFYCLLTGFPATQAALSGIALTVVSHREDDGKMISQMDGIHCKECQPPAGKTMAMTGERGRAMTAEQKQEVGGGRAAWGDFHLASC